MRFKAMISAAVVVTAGLGFTGTVQAQTTNALARPASLDLSQSAIAKLRTQGPSGLQAFLDAYGDKLQLGATDISATTTSQKNPPSSGDWQRPAQTLHATSVHKALDAICQQRDCYASRLYWYTDLEQAKTAAKATGKPILSLRLLGRLDEELSCANSRFFRIVLYPNAEVSKVLRDRFILHWQSVRPVPKVTIDFGDGRKMETTVTGNSIHYILDSEGRPIDALPGLYGPQAFLQKLAQAEQAVKDYTKRTGAEREDFLRQYHRDRLAAIQANWAADLSKLGISSPPVLVKIPNLSDNPPTAQEAARIAISKTRVENPIITSIFSAASGNQKALTAATDEAIWGKIAQLHATQARLDNNSQALMRRKNPALQTPVIQKFQESIALDTVRNEYQLHSQLHQWFIRGIGTNNVDNLNEQVYKELFLTPKSDPWLGLFPRNAYTAIENDGISP